MPAGEQPVSEIRINPQMKQTVNEIAQLEYQRISSIQDDRDARQVELIIKMKPLMRTLSAMKQELGEVEWLAINIEHGSCAHVTTTSWELEGGIKRTYMISFKADYSNSSVDYSKYTVNTMINNNGSDGHELRELESIDEVLALVTEVVGKHIGALKAQTEHKQKKAILFTENLFAI
jgi:hypothetical protein